MRELIKNLGNSVITEMAMNILICCWVTITVSANLYGEWTSMAAAASIGEGVVLAAWLIWCTYIIKTKKKVNEMPIKSRRAIEICSWIFLIYCILVNISPALAWRGMIQASWLTLAACLGYFINQKIEQTESSAQ